MVLLNANCKLHACNIYLTLNVYLTFFAIHFIKNNLGIIDLQCCNHYHLLSLLSDFSSKFQSSMTNAFKLFHKKCHWKHYYADT
jgi:hypothetical protein